MTARERDHAATSVPEGRIVELRLPCADGVDVAAALHLPAALHPPDVPDAADPPAPAARTPVLLLPGARGDHAAAHLVALAEVLAVAGHPVVRAALSPRPPGAGVVGPAERSIGRLGQVLAAARALVAARCGLTDTTPWVVGGASYGGRVASLAVAQSGGAALGVVGLLLIAYPLHPPGRPERPRVEHLGRVDVPTLLLSGDRDPFLTLSLVEQHLPAFGAPATLVLVPGAVHDLSVSGRSAPDGRRRTPGEVVAEHAGAVRSWAAGLPGPGRTQG